MVAVCMSSTEKGQHAHVDSDQHTGSKLVLNVEVVLFFWGDIDC